MQLSQAESAVLRVCKGIIDQKKVIYAPYPLICKRTETGLEHRGEWREEILVRHILPELPSVEIFSHRRIGRIIVHIAHADDLDAGIFLLHHHRMLIHYLASAVT